MEGWLRKQGENKGGIQGSTRTRYFRIEGIYLRYYKSPDDSTALGVIQLDAIKSISNLDRENDPYWFQVITPSRTYILQAETEFSVVYWTCALMRESFSQNTGAVLSRKSKAFVSEYLQNLLSDELGELTKDLLDSPSPPRFNSSSNHSPSSSSPNHSSSSSSFSTHQNPDGPCTELMLSVRCRHLEDTQLLSQRPSPQVQVFFKPNSESSWVAIGETEAVQKSSKPSFLRTFQLTYRPESLQLLKFDVYDVPSDPLPHLRSSSRALIGTATFVMGEVLHARDGSATKALVHSDHLARGVRRGAISVSLDEIRADASQLPLYDVTLQLSARHLANQRRGLLLLVPPDPVLVLQRARGGLLESGWVTLHRSKPLKATASPDWQPLALALPRDTYHRPLRVEVRSGKRGQPLGMATFPSFKALLASGHAAHPLAPTAQLEEHADARDQPQPAPGTPQLLVGRALCLRRRPPPPDPHLSPSTTSSSSSSSSSSSFSTLSPSPACKNALSASPSLSSLKRLDASCAIRDCYHGIQARLNLVSLLSGDSAASRPPFSSHAFPLPGQDRHAALLDALERLLPDAPERHHAVLVQRVAAAARGMLELPLEPLLPPRLEALLRRCAAADVGSAPCGMLSGAKADSGGLYQPLDQPLVANRPLSPSLVYLSGFLPVLKPGPLSLVPRGLRKFGVTLITSDLANRIYPGLSLELSRMLKFFGIRHATFLLESSSQASPLPTTDEQISNTSSHSISSSSSSSSSSSTSSTSSSSTTTTTMPSTTFSTSSSSSSSSSNEWVTANRPSKQELRMNRRAGTWFSVSAPAEKPIPSESLAKFDQLKSSHHRMVNAPILRCTIDTLAESVIGHSCEWGCPTIVMGFCDAGVVFADLVATNAGIFDRNVLHAFIPVQAPYQGSLLSTSAKISSFFTEQTGSLQPEYRRQVIADDPYPADRVRTISLAFAPPSTDSTLGLLKPIAQLVQEESGEITDGFMLSRASLIPDTQFGIFPGFSLSLAEDCVDDPLLLLLATLEFLLT